MTENNEYNESNDKYDALINEVNVTPNESVINEALAQAEAEKTAVFEELQSLDWGFRYQNKDGADIELLRHTANVLKSKIDARKETINAINDWVRDQSEFDDQTKELLEILDGRLGLDITTSEVIDVTIGAKVYITRKVWEDADTVVSEVVENLNVSISEGWSNTSVDDYEITSIEKEW